MRTRYEPTREMTVRVFGEKLTCKDATCWRLALIPANEGFCHRHGPDAPYWAHRGERGEHV